VSFINPKNSIRQIAKACNMTDMEIRKVVYGLMNAGLVELIKPIDQKGTGGRPGGRPGAPKVGLTTAQRPTITKLIDKIKNL